MPRGRKKKFKVNFNIKADTARSLLALFFTAFSLIMLISFFAPGYSLNARVQDILSYYFGKAAFLVPFITFGLGLLFIEKVRANFKEVRILIGLFILLISLAGIFHVFIPLEKALESAENGMGGGMAGYYVASVMSENISVIGTILVLIILLAVSIFLLFNFSIDQVLSLFGNVKLPQGMSFLKARGNKLEDEDGEIEITPGVFTGKDEDKEEKENSPAIDAVPEFEVIPSLSEPVSVSMTPLHANVSTESPLIDGFDMPRPLTDKIWQNPPLDLLTEPPSEVKDVSDTDKRGQKIKDTLRSFGIDVDIVNTQVGPSITQYALSTKSVTKVSKIASLHEDLAYALASPTGSVRIEAPIPGKSLIGIEVPNVNRSNVYFKSLITSEYMKNMKSKLGIVLGKDVAGKTHINDISTMPHMLIAGTTGSGKSVFIHNILFSILFRANPSEVKFILIDPKRVELSHYKDIPHLYSPVVVDMDEAASVFKWAVAEMDKRYKLFEQAKVRNIVGYNEKSGIQIMPYIVIVVDEFAEIMVHDPKGVESSIIRIAQLARATGIHLVLATQRPSINVVTGLIKANIPCRLSFKVASQIDSRVIIDQPGAEKLLERGDMLFIPPNDSKPLRLQAAYISDKEIDALVTYLKNQGVPPDYKSEILHYSSDKISKSSGSSEWGDDVDPLFGEAVEICTNAGKASASLLQRKLKIGYARAARIMDQMEEHRLVGSSNNGSKARDVIISDSEPIPASEDDFDID